MSLALTGFSLARGKRDFARLYHTKGRKELSVTQMILVTVFIVVFAISLVPIFFVLDWQ